jgi:hypothetical protein
MKWNIIGPEIKNDSFYYDIIKLIQNENINTILEIGASSGEGSTEAIMTGKNISQNKDNIKIFSLEVCSERFELLKKRYENESNFYPYNCSSVDINEFPSVNEIISFCNEGKTFMNPESIPTVLSWYNSDISYIAVNNIQQNGINTIKKEHNIEKFDMVLIDGSEFTGFAELQKVYGAKFILLDDINAFKNYKSNQMLKNDKNYQLLTENNQLRNGYTIYKRVKEL